MTCSEKADMLKSTIAHLYSKEGRPINYISKLLEIDRKALTIKIREWNLPEAEPRHHFSPSMRKFVNKNRQYIKSQLDKDAPMTEIADSLKISRHALYRTIILNDGVLKKAHDDYIARVGQNTQAGRRKKMDNSHLCYQFEDIPGERWEPILGYDGYMVSNMGRVKHYAARYRAYHLIRAFPNKNNGCVYVMLYNGELSKNLSLARLVAHAFVSGYSEGADTVNHKDGDVSNNKAENLEWVSQGEDNTHAYRELGRAKNSGKNYDFRKILYQNKYEFKTVAAFARFIGKSETQARRYLDAPSKHGIKLVK